MSRQKYTSLLGAWKTVELILGSSRLWMVLVVNSEALIAICCHNLSAKIIRTIVAECAGI